MSLRVIPRRRGGRFCRGSARCIGAGHLRAMAIRWQNAGSDAKSLICRVSSAVEQRFCNSVMPVLFCTGAS